MHVSSYLLISDQFTFTRLRNTEDHNLKSHCCEKKHISYSYHILCSKYHSYGHDHKLVAFLLCHSGIRMHIYKLVQRLFKDERITLNDRPT
jgi:hypothetical protein